MVHSSVLHCHLTILALLALTFPCLAVEDKWTPAGYNWSAVDAGPPESWKGLYLNSNDTTALHSDVAALTSVRTTPNGTTLLVIPWYMGLAWHTFSGLLTAGGLASTIKTCRQNKGQPDNIFYCITGLLSTVVGIGSHASAAKTFAESRGYFGVAANAWSNSGLENIAMHGFDRRGLDGLNESSAISQRAHNHFVHQALGGLEVDDVAFVGYAPDNHKLNRRDSTVHPHAPMFRFTHTRYGPMELTSRDTGDDGLHFTITYGDHPTHHASQVKRDEFFRHERLSQNLMEARFDSEASRADPGDISFSGADAFSKIESQMECFVGTAWNAGHVLSVQMFDQANKATFGYGSMGLFPDHSVDSALKSFGPRGLPLTGGQNC